MAAMSRDWRLPENRREAFLRFYSFHIKHKSHPGGVYSLLPAIAEHYDLDEDQRAWLVWLNGNTQNPAMSLLLLEAAPRPEKWRAAVDFWNTNFKLMEWDTDRRHQKSKFGEATEKWWVNLGGESPADAWDLHSLGGWRSVWPYALSQPYMGRLSAWSMAEYARILLSWVPDPDDLLLYDASGSRSHRNGLCILDGQPPEAAWWEWKDIPGGRDYVAHLETLAEEVLQEARAWNPWHPHVGYLTMESALCTWKSWHKPNRRYPNVYSDMAYNRIRKAEARFGKRFEVLWEARRRDLPAYLRLEDSPHDPGLSPIKQNLYRETGVPPMMHRDYPDMSNPLNLDIDMGTTPVRKDPKWN